VNTTSRETRFIRTRFIRSSSFRFDLSATAIHGTGIKALRLMHWPLQVKEAGSSARLDNGIPQKVQSGLLPARHARTWAALYQQRPPREEGDYFKADWLRVVERAPPNLRT